MKTSESIAELASAMALAQAEMGGAHKGASNPFFKKNYADLSSVIAALKAPFAANGLSYVQFPSMSDGMVTVTTRLMHKSGEWLEGTSMAPLAKNDAQAVGACISYLRRYSLQSAAGIPAVDSDMELGMDRTPAAPAPATITEQQAQELQAIAQHTGTMLTKICSAYKVDDIYQLNATQFDQVMERLQQRLAEKVEGMQNMGMGVGNAK